LLPVETGNVEPLNRADPFLAAATEKSEIMESSGTVAVRKILSLGEPGGTADRLGLGPDVEWVQVDSVSELLNRLGESTWSGVFFSGDDSAVEGAGFALRLGCSFMLLEHYPDGVAILDKESTVVWVNRRLGDWFSGSPMVGLSFYEAVGHPAIAGPEIHPLSSALKHRRVTTR
jgi:hypothetical protein